MRQKRDLRAARLRLASAGHVQAVARSWLARQKLAREKAAVKTLQRRVFLRQFSDMMGLKRWLVVALQRLFRGNRCRRQLARLMKAILTLQGVWRRRRVLIVRLRRDKAAAEKQRRVRNWAVRRQQRVRHRTVVVIQAAVRRRICMRRWKRQLWAKEVIGNACCRYQFRMHIFFLKELYHKLAKVFKEYRPVALRKRVKVMAVLLQKIARGYLGRQRVAAMKRASATLQKMCHGAAGRAKAAARLHGIVFLQKIVLGSKARQAYRRTLPSLVQRRERPANFGMLKTLPSLVQIQSLWRRALARQWFARQRGNATHLQCFFRGCTDRMRTAAMLGSRHKLRLLVGRHARYKFRRKVAWAGRIQRIWRGTAVRWRFSQMTHAATYIRRWLRDRWSWRSFARRVRAAATLQRGWWVRAHARQLTRTRLAATRIASVWRGYCVRASEREKHAAVACIQRAWRAIEVMHRLRPILIECSVLCRKMRPSRTDLSRTLWRTYRRYRAGTDVAAFRAKRAAAVRLQAWARGWLARVQLAMLGRIRLRGLASSPARLARDRRGRLTRLEPGEGARVVNLRGLTALQQIALEDSLAPLQGWWRFKAREHAARRLQAWIRAVRLGRLDRRALRVIRGQWGRET